MLFGRQTRNAEWLTEVAGVDRDDVDTLAAGLRGAQRAALLVFARWVLVMTTFERALYADPDADLDTLWWELVSRFQGVTPPAGRQAPDWAAKIHIAVSPVYYHTYLYGAIVALQLAAGLDSQAGGIVDRPQAGALLRAKLFEPGESVRWDRLVEQASGSPLSVESLAREVALA